MVILRLYLVIAGLALAISVLLALLLHDRRWFRFGWQLLKFSVVLLLVVLTLVAIGRAVLVL
jgi:hypothetical protein